jgi:DNA mismatch endonuclease Vsr
MDKHTPEQRRKNMRAVKNKGSNIERILRKELWARGYRYRKNYSKVEGKPDIAFVGKKIAIFADSEFWHGKDWDNKKHEIKSNKKFWYNKIEANIKRDIIVNQILEKAGWRVLRFWGKEILSNPKKCVQLIERVLLNDI